MTYFVTVSGMNGAHDVVSATTNGITVDSTPPILLSQGDGGKAGKDMDYTASASVYTINFRFVDRESGVTGYHWALFESITPTVSRQVYPPAGRAYATLTASEAQAGKATVNMAALNMTLHTGVHYYAKVIASNDAGLDIQYVNMEKGGVFSWRDIFLALLGGQAPHVHAHGCALHCTCGSRPPNEIELAPNSRVVAFASCKTRYGRRHRGLDPTHHGRHQDRLARHPGVWVPCFPVALFPCFPVRAYCGCCHAHRVLATQAF